MNWMSGVVVYVVLWWLVMFCLAPKAKNTHPWEIVLKGAKRAPGAYFAVIGRRKSDLLIIEGCRRSKRVENSVHEVAILLFTPYIFLPSLPVTVVFGASESILIPRLRLQA